MVLKETFKEIAELFKGSSAHYALLEEVRARGHMMEIEAQGQETKYFDVRLICRNLPTLEDIRVLRGLCMLVFPYDRVQIEITHDYQTFQGELSDELEQHIKDYVRIEARRRESQRRNT